MQEFKLVSAAVNLRPILIQKASQLRPKSLAIFSRCQTNNPEEDLPKRTRVGITDLPSNAFDRQKPKLQEFLRLGDAKALSVVGRSHARGFLKATQEGPFFQPCLFG